MPILSTGSSPTTGPSGLKLLKYIGPALFNEANFSRSALGQMVTGASEDRGSLKGLRNQSFVASGNSVNRLSRRARAASSSQIAQGMPATAPSFSSALSDALRRTKVRGRIAAQGDSQIQQQGLRDRIAIAQNSRSRSGDLMNAEAKAANIREGVNVGVADANAANAAGRAGMWGTIGGSIAGVLANKEGREGLQNLIGGIGGIFGGKKGGTGASPSDSYMSGIR